VQAARNRASGGRSFSLHDLAKKTVAVARGCDLSAMEAEHQTRAQLTISLL